MAEAIDIRELNERIERQSAVSYTHLNNQPKFPFLCLLVSGGNSQIILVKAYNDMEVCQLPRSLA